MLHHYRMFADYNRWANQRLYDACATLSDAEFRADKGAFFGSLHRTLNHILVGDRAWMKRLTGTGPAPRALDEILFDAFAELRAAREAEDARIIDWLGALDDDALSALVEYTPITSPTPVIQRRDRVLAHVFNHQTHHRGQAHAILTALGKPSLLLDLVYFQRTDGAQWS